MKKYFIWTLILGGILLYSKSFSNGFVGDDIGYINHPYIQNFQIFDFFQSGSADLGGQSSITGSFFRPLMLLVISSIYQISGSFAATYHFIQLLIHIVNVILIFFIFKKFFKDNLAFILALIYLVHPINVETVSYISNLQDVLFVFFGLSGLLVLINDFGKKYNVLLVNGLLFMSLLSKETGLLFGAIYMLWVCLYKKESIKNLLTSLMLAIVPYIFIRFILAGVWLGAGQHTVFGKLSLPERVINIPAIILHYLYTFVFPKDLVLGQTWITTKDYGGLYLPIITVALGIISLTSLLIKLRSKKILFLPLVFFTVWFVMGLFMHLQIFPLEMTVADRWFYFPLIGLLGIIGVTVQSTKNKQFLHLLTLVGLIFILGFFIRSHIRIGDFKNSLTLYSHDAKLTKSYLLEHSLGFELMQEKKYKEAYSHLQNAFILFPNTNNTNTLGVYYYQTLATASAIEMFEKSIALGDNYLAYKNASQIYTNNNNFKEAERVLIKATKAFPNDANFWFLLSIAKYKLGQKDKALDAAEKAYKLSPTQQNFYIVNQLRADQPIKFSN